MPLKIIYTGTVLRIHPQPPVRGKRYPTLLTLTFEDLPTQQFQVPEDTEVSVGDKIVLTLEGMNLSPDKKSFLDKVAEAVDRERHR